MVVLRSGELSDIGEWVATNWWDPVNLESHVRGVLTQYCGGRGKFGAKTLKVIICNLH